FQERRLEQMPVVSRPGGPGTEYGQGGGYSEGYDISDERADLLHVERHVNDERIDIDMGTARYCPGSAEKSDIDQRIFRKLRRSHDGPAEEVAHHHVDADGGAARDQDKDCDLREEVFRAGKSAGELRKPLHGSKTIPSIAASGHSRNLKNRTVKVDRR